MDGISAKECKMIPHVHGEEGEHRHIHSPEEKKAVVNRLSRAIGHLEAVRRMVEKDADCMLH